MRALRNIAIIAALAFVVAAVPGGGNLATGILAALTITFLAMIATAVYFAWRQNQFAYMALTDRQRATLLAALGAIALMVAGADELLETGIGAVAWIAVLGLSIFAIVRVVVESRSY
ncbi:MAG TPA: hypothetical protein VIL04_09740 [Solirubrobacterales bacterium]